MKKPTLFYAGSKGKNFGDTINPYFFEKVFGISFKRAYPSYSDVIGIGSLMSHLTLKTLIKYKKLTYFYRYNFNPIIVMGTGFPCNVDGNNFLTKTYREVYPIVIRGKLSHNELEKINNKPYQNIAYGDLGLLFNFLLEKM